MGMMARFERRLQGAVDGVFARAFGGAVMPQEVEAALQREAADQLRELDGGHLLAPNSYVVTVNESDHAQLASDRDLAVRAFSRHLEDYLHDQGWQTYGEVLVEFEPSPTLHTGQFSTRGRVDPDARRPAGPAPAGAAPAPQQRGGLQAAAPHQGGLQAAAQHQPVPSAPPQPGAGPMTQNSGYDPSREDPSYDPRRGWQDDQRGYAQQPQPAGRPGYQNGAYPPDDGQYGGAAGARPYQNGGTYPDPRGGQGGYADPAYGGQNYQNGGYQDQGGYGGQGYDQGYADPGYQDQGGQQGYPDQGGQQGYPDQYGAQAYQQGYQDQQGYADQGGYQDQQYAPQQQGYGGAQQYPDQGGGYGQPGYGQPAAAEPGYAAPAAAGYGAAGYTATLQLDDGSGRTYQLREGSNIIGRGQDAHFRLPDTGVSRRHIEVRWDGQVAMLSDLGSTNGTLVNGSPVQDWQLADGDIVRAGHSEILIRIV